MLRHIIIGRPNGFRRKTLGKVWEIITTYFDDSPEISKDVVSSENKNSSQETSYQTPHNPPNNPPNNSTNNSTNLEPPRNVTPPEGFEVVLHIDALKEDEVTQIIIAGTAIAIARSKDGFFAIENNCPHAGGPMSEGFLEGNQISCPYHGWAFDLRDGSCTTNPQSCLQTYEVQTIDTAVCVKI